MNHPHAPDASFNGGDLNCGNGLLLLIRKHIDPLPPGGLLEIRSSESSVREDLPAWCRMTGNELVNTFESEDELRFLVCKGKFAGQEPTAQLNVENAAGKSMPMTQSVVPVEAAQTLPEPRDCLPIPPLAVMGIGSWPRPRWLLQAIHEHLEGRLSHAEFQATADDAVKLCVASQVAAGVNVATDGEQRRDSYSSFVGALLDNCQLIPLTDLLPYVDDPDKFAAELRALDIPAAEVRHPAVFGPLGRSQSLAVHEFEYAATQTDLPIKVALPGPYLLTRTMWMECISDRAYDSRETLATDIVRVLREELHHLLHAGVSLVQFDEPVLTEVAFAKPAGGRSFMCGALGEKLPIKDELQFASQLYADLTANLPEERIGIHICRGNWSRDESLALTGPYSPLMNFLCELPVGNYFLEMCTPRAGELEILAQLPSNRRVGIGVVNQKLDAIESTDEIRKRIEAAVAMFGQERLMLTPDCGFSTFADNPIASAEVAAAKLAAISQVRGEVMGS